MVCCLQLGTNYTRNTTKFLPMDLFRADRIKKVLHIYLNCYSNISARLWNALIPKVNTNVSLPKFKSLLKQFLLFDHGLPLLLCYLYQHILFILFVLHHIHEDIFIPLFKQADQFCQSIFFSLCLIYHIFYRNII